MNTRGKKIPNRSHKFNTDQVITVEGLENDLRLEHKGDIWSVEENVKVTLEYAKNNFMAVSAIADENGEVYIVEDGRPKYKLVNLEGDGVLELTHEERVDIIAKRVLKKYEGAFKELAK